MRQSTAAPQPARQAPGKQPLRAKKIVGAGRLRCPPVCRGRVVGGWLPVAALLMAGMPASPVEAQTPTPPAASPAETGTAESATETDRLPADPEAMIEALGAPAFADREHAAADVMDAGAGMLPALQEAAESHPDLEIRLRSQVLYRRVARHDFESRAARFLASESPGDLMPGWPAVAPLLGDHSAA